jgi:hypothetical protein
MMLAREKDAEGANTSGPAAAAEVNVAAIPKRLDPKAAT